MFRHLQALDQRVNEENWTSSLRRYAFPQLTVFKDQDSVSDFKYNDTEDKLAKLLGISDGRPRNLLLEVKASRDVENGFAFSPRHFRTVQNTRVERS